MGRRSGGIAAAVAVAIACTVPASAAGAAGRWKVVTADLGAHTVLHSIACADATTCFAVGTAGQGTDASSVIARWDGKSWTRAQHPRLGRDELWGVHCAGVSWCVAVGSYVSSTGPVTLVETWDGTRWALAPSPNPSEFGNHLLSVSCSSRFRCAAVGYLTDMHGYVYPIALNWTGFQWIAENAPYTGILVPNVLAGVACPTDGRCEAVGSTGVDSQTNAPLVAGWNGRKWAIQSAANPGSASRSLAAVSCTTVRHCVAVGQQDSSPLAESWDGTTWSLLPTADPGTPFSTLAGFACVRTLRCLAVGGAGADATHRRPLIESARGSTWSVVAAPAIAGDDDTLAGVACASDTLCFAVGTTNASGHPGPLVLTGPS